MDRPKYKQLYLEQKDLADCLSGRLNQVTVALDIERKASLGLSRSRAGLRSDYYTLHQRAGAFLDRIQHYVMRESREKNGWLYIPALDPETAYSLRNKLIEFGAFVEEKQPPIL